MFSSVSLVTIKKSLSPSLDNNTIAVSFAVEQSRVILSFCFCRTLWAKLHDITSSGQLLHSRFLLPLKNNYLLPSAHIKTF